MSEDSDARGADTPLSVVRTIYAGWAEGDFSAAADRFDQHVVYVLHSDDMDRGAYHGMEALRDYMRGFLDTWESWQIDAVEYREVGESVLARVRRTGVGKGSGARIEDEAFQVWTVRGGRIIRVDVMEDERVALALVGLVS